MKRIPREPVARIPVTQSGFATSVGAIDAEESHDPSVTDHGETDRGGTYPGDTFPGDTVPVNTVAH